MKIAIIGTGISGNVAAYHLNKEHDVSVFEANDYVGGHTHTHDIEWQGSQFAVDTGFIVFNERTYPNFIALLDELGVAYRPTTMSFSVKSERNGLEYNGHSLNTLFAQRRNLIRPAFYRMIRDILRFNREAPLSLQRGEAESGLGAYLSRHGYSDEFKSHYIIPMGAAIWSSNPDQMQDFPAAFFIRFFDHHGLLEIKNRPKWFVIDGGSREYVRPLVRSFEDRIRTRTAIQSIRRFPTHVEIRPYGGPMERFDTVFIATHSDQALAMLDDATNTEREVLGAIQYQSNEALLHTDHSILPRERRAWAAWNYHVQSPDQEHVAVTYNMNILQGLDAPDQFCVTLNNGKAVDKSKIIERIMYDHPVFTPDAIAAQQRQHEINGIKRSYFCGAYWRNGFHEDGVVSALKALQHFEDQHHEELYLRRAG